jgi:hypothetical protein
MPAASPTQRFGLPFLVLLGLAAVASVRGLLHDLHVVETGDPVTVVLALVPLLLWVAVAVVWSRRPFLSLLVAGLLHGILLGSIHVALWDVNLAGAGIASPALGGELAGVLPPPLEAVLLRGAAFTSSLFVGAVLGAVAGLIAWGLRRLPALARLPRGGRPA